MEGYSVIRAKVPLIEMFGYLMAVRSLSSSQASFSIEFVTYYLVPTSQQIQLIEKTHQ